jgi:polysaccharide export outer membrane protein
MMFGYGSFRRMLAGLCLCAISAAVSTAQTAVTTQKLETAQQTNERIQQLAVESQTVAGDYRVGAGDLLAIEVFEVPELTRDVRVSQSGFITLPLLPMRIQVNGLTGSQIEEKITEILQAKGLISHPEVTVALKEQHSQPITIIGSVRQPKVIQSIRPVSLVEALSDAGGIADDAGNVVLVTKREPEPEAQPASGGTDGAAVDAAPDPFAGPQTISVNLTELLDRPDPKLNLMLRGGDIVSVPRGGIVYVVGAVNHPGGFVLQSNTDKLTALQALALAQGLTGTAKSGDAVIVRKDPTTGKNQDIRVDLKKILQRKGDDVTLWANDILFVPDSEGKRVLKTLGTSALTLTTGVAIVRGGQF